MQPCARCHGSGEVGAAGYSINPGSGTPVRDPQCDETGICPDCHGDGTQIRANLELMADAMVAPSIRQQTITEVVQALRDGYDGYASESAADFIERRFASVPFEQEQA